MTDNLYVDDDQIESPAHRDDVYLARQHGLMHGFPDGTFRPHDPVTRQQLATVACRLHGRTPQHPATVPTVWVVAGCLAALALAGTWTVVRLALGI